MTIGLRHIAFAILTFCGLTVYAQTQTTEKRNDFKKYYDQFKVDDSFILYDQNNNTYFVYNQSQTKEQFTPSSICNSLIGLETGVIKDNKDIGWHVGHLETKGNVYYFANCIKTTDLNNNDFAKARIDITNQILADLKLTTNENLKISHLTGDYYIFTTYKSINGNPFPSNGMYCVTDNGVVMFDTPWDTTQFQPLLDSIAYRHNQKVVACIATHFHDDRTAGLEYYKSKGIKTYSSKQTFDLCKQHNEKQAEFHFTKDTTFTIGNRSFQTYYGGEGHTKDNIVIWCNDAKILYGGCLVKSTDNDGLGNIVDANLNEWETTIKNVIKKYPKPDYVVPGHFGWTSNEGLQHTLKLLRQK